MPDNLRSKIIRLATTMPKGPERTALLNVLASQGPSADGSDWKPMGSGNNIRWNWAQRDGVAFSVTNKGNKFKLKMLFNNGTMFESKLLLTKEDQFEAATRLHKWYLTEGKAQDVSRSGEGVGGFDDLYEMLADRMPGRMSHIKLDMGPLDPKLNREWAKKREIHVKVDPFKFLDDAIRSAYTKAYGTYLKKSDFEKRMREAAILLGEDAKKNLISKEDISAWFDTSAFWNFQRYYHLETEPVDSQRFKQVVLDSYDITRD